MKFPRTVYAIQCGSNGKMYIGSTTNWKRRRSQHLYLLRRGEHPVEDLQKDFSENPETFTFSVLNIVMNRESPGSEFAYQLRYKTLFRSCGYNYKDPSARWSTSRHKPPELCWVPAK
jgi:hypothetical protein